MHSAPAIPAAPAWPRFISHPVYGVGDMETLARPVSLPDPCPVLTKLSAPDEGRAGL